jgi:MoaA/NifB/PqqE/SkfB family radical SAM enzyme
MKDLSKKFCKEPWNFLLVGTDYSTQCCYIRKNIGKIKSGDFNEIWNSTDAKEVRKSILDGNFKYCKQELCPFIQDDSLPDRNSEDPFIRSIIDDYILEYKEIPGYIHMMNDYSCNLECPSCRQQKITQFSDEKEFKLNEEFQRKLLELVGKNPNKIVTINITGSGDPFASKLYREFLFSIDGKKYPNLKIGLQTNGVMMTPKYWEKISRIHNNIIHIMISVDAATKEVYDKIRIGGDWDLLNDNLKHLKQEIEKNDYKFYVEMSFILQQKNYKDLPKFVELANWYGFTPVTYLIYPWYESSFFTDAMIYKEEHSEYNNFLETLRHPNFDKYNVKWGNVTPYRELAIN